MNGHDVASPAAPAPGANPGNQPGYPPAPAAMPSSPAESAPAAPAAEFAASAVSPSASAAQPAPAAPAPLVPGSANPGATMPASSGSANPSAAMPAPAGSANPAAPAGPAASAIFSSVPAPAARTNRFDSTATGNLRLRKSPRRHRLPAIVMALALVLLAAVGGLTMLIRHLATNEALEAFEEYESLVAGNSGSSADTNTENVEQNNQNGETTSDAYNNAGLLNSGAITSDLAAEDYQKNLQAKFDDFVAKNQDRKVQELLPEYTAEFRAVLIGKNLGYAINRLTVLALSDEGDDAAIDFVANFINDDSDESSEDSDAKALISNARRYLMDMIDLIYIYKMYNCVGDQVIDYACVSAIPEKNLPASLSDQSNNSLEQISELLAGVEQTYIEHTNYIGKILRGETS